MVNILYQAMKQPRNVKKLFGNVNGYKYTIGTPFQINFLKLKKVSQGKEKYMC